MQLTAGRFIVLAAIVLPLVAALWLFATGPGAELYRAFLAWVFTEQRAFQGSMTQALQDFAETAGVSAGVAIVGGSFFYGIFHAAGPGHGKVILSTYLLTQPEKVKKSVALAAISALVQGLVAIFLVYGLFYLFGVVSKDMKIAVSWSERLAFALVIAIGLILIWRAVKGLGWVRSSKTHTHHHNHHHDHGHMHDHHDHDHAHDHHHHHGEVCASCGHAHTLTGEQVDQATDLRSTIGVILSIGLRPCSGAVLVLVFARFAGIPWAGVMSVLAISLGTAITVSAIALLSVQARKLALSLAGSGTTVWVDRVAWSLALGGGALLVLFGWGLMAASFDAPVRSMGL